MKISDGSSASATKPQGVDMPQLIPANADGSMHQSSGTMPDLGTTAIEGQT
jgi:hypothetical protein